MRYRSIAGETLALAALFSALLLPRAGTAAPPGLSPQFLIPSKDALSSSRVGGRYDPHTPRVGSLQAVVVGGVEYYAFQLNLNVPASERFDDLSLNALRFYVADRGDIESLEALAWEGEILWDQDGLGDSRWDLERGLLGGRNGSGWTDLLVPKSAFEGVDPGKYLYLYSRIGAASGASPSPSQSAGVEVPGGKWRAYVESPAVPEPGTLLLVALGSGVLLLMRRRQRG